jgi:hypothetical protein
MGGVERRRHFNQNSQSDEWVELKGGDILKPENLHEDDEEGEAKGRRSKPRRGARRPPSCRENDPKLREPTSHVKPHRHSK